MIGTRPAPSPTPPGRTVDDMAIIAVFAPLAVRLYRRSHT